MSKRLELIVKLTERCNIACTYCYYFENDARSALTRPARITDDAADRLISRIDEYLRHESGSSIRVIFHGGEPLMYGKDRFSTLCASLRGLGHGEALSLCIQTNATLIDPDWIEIFSTFGIAVGVSIDGPSAIHDMHRVDKKGRGTHEKVVNGISLVIAAAKRGELVPPGALVVMQNHTDPEKIYDHVVRELGITQLDFLFPDATWDSKSDTEWVGPYLDTLFRLWANDSPAIVNVRFIKSTISLLMGGRSFLGGYGPENSSALTILADGNIDGDDFLRPCGDEFIKLDVSVFNSTFANAIVINKLRCIAMGAERLPDDCLDCAFRRTCCGGQITHRFSKERIFNNKTIYCEQLKHFYRMVCEKLVESDVPISTIEAALRGHRTPEKYFVTLSRASS